MGRVSREQAAENRMNVVAAASALLRRKGFDGVGIDELMAEVGLTRGGFYRQFRSKDALAGEACALAFDGAMRSWRGLSEGDESGRLRRVAAYYFKPKSPGRDCPMASLAGDAARAPVGGPLRRAFTEGLRKMANLLAGKQSDDKALALLAAIVGAAVLRRASEDAELSDAIEAAVLRLTTTAGDAAS